MTTAQQWLDLAERIEAATGADDLTELTFEELIERLPTPDRLAEVAEQLSRLGRICKASPRRMTLEGSANKVLIPSFMQSAIDDAAFAALALRQLLPLALTAAPSPARDDVALERLAEALCDDAEAREIAGQDEAPAFRHAATDVREYWRIIARVALSGRREG